MSPAGETGTSSTPPQANAPAHHASTIEYTLKSRGAHVVNENIGVVGVQAKEVRPWIQRDIEQVKQCMANAMLEALLQRTSCAAETKQPESAPWKLCRSAMDRPPLEIYSSGVVQDWVTAKIFLGEADRTSEPENLKKSRRSLSCTIHFTAKSFSTFDRAGHLNLWKEGVYHQDITPGNLMWYRKNGKLIDVLNDYDLSSSANVVGPRGNERTGTVPFMALDLLSAKAQRGEVKHLYRHDLESFMRIVLRRSIQLPTVAVVAFAVFDFFNSDRWKEQASRQTMKNQYQI
ncbi:hypothetical protein F4604DRAFT_1677732 [Suillus subluteus]|nr:hypothetical protein F4604DRAFT_1677732 [Suillus subluteus]